jgi:hypothetical protein
MSVLICALFFWDALSSILCPTGYIQKVLKNAKVYSTHAKKSKIDIEDVTLSIKTILSQSFVSPPPREVLVNDALRYNSRPIPPIPALAEVILPEKKYCLSSAEASGDSVSPQTAHASPALPPVASNISVSPALPPSVNPAPHPRQPTRTFASSSSSSDEDDDDEDDDDDAGPEERNFSSGSDSDGSQSDSQSRSHSSHNSDSDSDAASSLEDDD